MPLLGRRVTASALVAAAIIIFGPGVSPAQTPPPSVPAAQPTRTFATLTVNGLGLGDALIALVPGDVYLRVSDFSRSGITAFAGSRRTIFNEAYVSLNSLEPGFTYTFDVKTLTLDVIAHSAGLLGSRSIDLARGFPADTRFERDRGAFLNYALFQSQVGHPTAFFESGITLPRALFYNTFQYGIAGTFTRGITQLLYDNRDKLRRVAVGDAAIGTGALGGAAALGGIVASRQFTLNPYVLTFPTPAFSGQVLLPSQAEVYVNGQLVRTIDLQPGQFVLQDIPTDVGFSQTRVVIRNASGVTTQSGSSFFTTSGLLRRGLTDYAYGAGLLRTSLLGSAHYGQPVLLGRYAVGMSDRLTLGGRVEAGRGTVSGGVNVVRTLGGLAVQISTAASESRGTGGAAGSLAITVPSRRAFGIGGSLQWQSLHYSTVSQGPFDPRPLFEAGLTASLILSKTTALSGSLQNVLDSRNGPSSILEAAFSQQLGRQMNLVIQATRTRGRSILGSVTQNTFTAGLVRPLGDYGNAGVSYSSQSGPDGHSAATVVSLSHSQGADYGLAYDANVGFGDGRSISGALQYQNQLGSSQLFVNSSSAGTSVDFSYNGGMAFVRNHFFLTRTINDAYGLVDAPGLGGARVFANNRYQGKTNRAGLAVVPELTSDVPNEVRLVLPQQALDATVTGPSNAVAPAFRSAVVFPYQVQRVRAVLLTLALKRKNGMLVTPLYGQFTVNVAGIPESSEIDGAGRAYFNDLPAGRYDAKIEYASETCNFPLEVPTRDQAVINLGLKTCDE